MVMRVEHAVRVRVRVRVRVSDTVRVGTRHVAHFLRERVEHVVSLLPNMGCSTPTFLKWHVAFLIWRTARGVVPARVRRGRGDTPW